MATQGYPVDWEADALLRDGHPVHLRPITEGDADALRAFHRSLSERTVYFRFFAAKPELTDRDVAHLTAVDHVHRVALIALDDSVICGVGRFDDIGDGSAEVAFVVRDDMQGRGLGSVLLEHLAAAARERGLTRFVAEVLPENGRMLATFIDAGFDVQARREDDVLVVTFAIEQTLASVTVMSAREHRAEAVSVRRLLHPRAVAVVGASRHPGGMGHEVLRHLVEGGFTGSVVAVHPEVDAIRGVPCVRTLADAAGVDLAIVVVPAERVVAVIEDAASAGVHGVVVMSGAFGDSGPEGLAMQAELVGLVRRTGMRLVGPNALGLINTDPSVRLNASLVPTMPAAGRVGAFSQSGALGGSILERLHRRGLGVSTFVSAGNRADISGNDLLQYWEEDDATDVVLLYLETIGNARKFARIVHRMSAVKPVAMVRMGGADQQHPLGHAAASTLLSQRAVDQMLADCGLIVADSVDQLLDVARLAVGQPLPTGTGIAIIGNSDALSVMAVNALSRTHLALARPPATFARQESASAYQSASHAAVEDPSVGAVLAVYVPPIEHPSDAAIRDALRECARDASAHGKPLVAVMLSESSQPSSDEVPAFPDVDAAVQALSLVARYSQWRRKDAARRDAIRDSAGDDSGRSAARRSAILPRGTQTGDAIAEAVSSTGLLPLTMRPGEAGIVGCRIRLVTDPLFGPVVSAGVDDPVAEILDDRSYRLAPVTPTAAVEMLMALGSIGVLGWGDEELLDTATAVASVSRMPAVVDGLESVDLRHAVVRQGFVTAADVSLTVSDEVTPPDAPARRL